MKKALHTASPHHPPTVRGFTLIEIIIAITLLSLLMISVVNMTSKSLESKDAIVKEDREILELETALDRLNWDFSQIYTPLYHTPPFQPPERKRSEEAFQAREKMKRWLENPLYGEYFLHPDFFGRPIPDFKSEGGKEAIEFYTKSHRRRFRDTNESEFAWVRYEFRPYRGDDEDNKDLYELVRYYNAQHIYNRNLDLKETPAIVLTNRVKEFRFLFWDDERKKWLPRYLTEKLPPPLRGLKLELKWKRRSDGAELTTSRTYRTIWPYFIPSNLNKLQFQTPAPLPPSTFSQEEGR